MASFPWSPFPCRKSCKKPCRRYSVQAPSLRTPHLVDRCPVQAYGEWEPQKRHSSKNITATRSPRDANDGEEEARTGGEPRRGAREGPQATRANTGDTAVTSPHKATTPPNPKKETIGKGDQGKKRKEKEAETRNGTARIKSPPNIHVHGLIHPHPSRASFRGLDQFWEREEQTD